MKSNCFRCFNVYDATYMLDLCHSRGCADCCWAKLEELVLARRLVEHPEV